MLVRELVGAQVMVPKLLFAMPFVRAELCTRRSLWRASVSARACQGTCPSIVSGSSGSRLPKIEKSENEWVRPPRCWWSAPAKDRRIWGAEIGGRDSENCFNCACFPEQWRGNMEGNKLTGLPYHLSQQ